MPVSLYFFKCGPSTIHDSLTLDVTLAFLVAVQIGCGEVAYAMPSVGIACIGTARL